MCSSDLVVSDSVTPWTVACQVPLSMGFSSQAYWSGLPFPPPGDLPKSVQTHPTCATGSETHSQTHTHTPPSTCALMYMPVYTCTRTGTSALPYVLGVSGKPQAMGSLSRADHSILLSLPVLLSTVTRLGWCVMGLVMFEAPKYKWRCL